MGKNGSVISCIGFVILIFYVIQSLSTGIHAISAVISTIAWLMIVVGMIQANLEEPKSNIAWSRREINKLKEENRKLEYGIKELNERLDTLEGKIE